MKSLVLGANGHIGSNLVRVLLEAGRPVRGLVRPGGNLAGLRGLDVEVVEGDVLDRASLVRAFQGCEVVYHLATPSALDPRVEEIAVEGTRNVLDAVRCVPGVKRVIYTSSIITMGLTRDRGASLDESAFARLTATAGQVAKWKAEEMVRATMKERDLPVVIVNPGTVIGPNDHRPTPTNLIIVDFLKKGMWFYFDGGFTIVDVEDVARGHLLAEQRGRIGERYILGGETVTVKELYRTLSEVTGLPTPRLYLPKPAMLTAGFLLETWARIRGRRPRVTYRMMQLFVGSYSFHSSARAARELGYTARPFRSAIERAVRWFLDSEMVPAWRKAKVKLQSEASAGRMGAQ